MKKTKKLLALLLSLLLFGSMMIGGFAADDSIGVWEACRLTMADAGLNYDRLEREHFIPYMSDIHWKENFSEDPFALTGYEIDFVYRGQQYAYLVAPNGAILEKTVTNTMPAISADCPLTEDLARAIAVAYIGYPDQLDQAKNWKIQFDMDDGRYVCDVDFLFDARSASVSEPNAIYEYEYELEIDCNTGAILSSDCEDNTRSFLSLLTDFFNRIVIFFRQIFGVFA